MPGGERSDHRHDLDDPGEDADQQPVRQPVEPEGQREHRADERDHHQLAAHEGTELGVDQIPGVPDHLPRSAAASTRTSAWARSFSKIQYAATANVKKIADEDLERRAAVGDRRVDEAGAARQPLEPVLDPDEDLVLDPVRLLGGFGDVGGRRRQRPDRRLDLVEGPRDDQPQQEADRAPGSPRSGWRRRARAEPRVCAGTPHPGARRRRSRLRAAAARRAPAGARARSAIATTATATAVATSDLRAVSPIG